MKRIVIGTAITLSLLVLPAAAQQYGNGPGWMPWGQQGWGQQGGGQQGWGDQGQGWGPGPGWGAGPGWGPGMGQGPGWGPGMMGQGPGWGSGGMGPGMVGQGQMGPGMMNAPGRGRFASIDENQDGVVSAEEAASAVDQVFSAMDADDDGILTVEEYLAVRMGPADGRNTARQAARQAAKEARFGEMDVNDDGSVSKAEFIDGGKAHFEAADTDKDGKVTPWEMRRQAWN